MQVEAHLVPRGAVPARSSETHVVYPGPSLQHTWNSAAHADEHGTLAPLSAVIAGVGVQPAMHGLPEAANGAVPLASS